MSRAQEREEAERQVRQAVGTRDWYAADAAAAAHDAAHAARAAYAVRRAVRALGRLQPRSWGKVPA